MKQVYKIALSKIAEDFKLEVIVRPEDFDRIQITSPEVNRPGLPLTGFLDYFDPSRVERI